MKIISHRGNLNGRDEQRENNPIFILPLTVNYDVEIDLWLDQGQLFLGHDYPNYAINANFFNERMWIHCKNLEAVEYMLKTKWNWFWHQTDKLTITSKGVPWCFPNVYINNGITVMDEYNKNIPNFIAGICTDYPLSYE